MTDNVLVMITTAFNATGIKDAQKGFLGMSSSLTALVAGLGLAVVAGKSMIEITEKHDKAEKDLEQAVAAVNDQYGKTTPRTVDLSKETDALTTARRHLAEVEAGLPTKHKATHLELMHLQDAQKRVKEAQQALTKAQAASLPVQHTQMIYLQSYRAEIDKFIADNRAYISDQAEVIDGYATLTRAGLNVNEVQKDMNRALDLAAIKHISLAEAVDLINKAEHGRLRGLIDLGIVTKNYTDAEGNLINGTKDLDKVWAQADPRLAHGRGTLTNMDQATKRLSNDWQDMAKIVGPPLIDFLSGAAMWLDTIIHKLDDLGHNKDWNKFLHEAFGGLQRDVLILTLGVRDLLKLLGIAQGQAKGIGGSLGGLLAPKKAATGYEGMVSRPTLFMAGEAGTEHVSITPSGGGGGGARGGNVYIDLRGAFVPDGPSIDRLANLILQRARHAPGM